MTRSQHLWEILRQQAQEHQVASPLLKDFFQQVILQHPNLATALASLLAQKLQTTHLLSIQELENLLKHIFTVQPDIVESLCKDLDAVMERDCACHQLYQAFCFYKGFHALATYRAMHALWLQQRTVLALQLQQRSAMVFDVDIHPAARIGKGILLDHATGIVIGETAVVGDNVSIMQGVTLGGTGKSGGDRHPKIRDGVLISVGATILGNIEVGEGAQIAAGSVVLKPVPAHQLAAGVPADITGKTRADIPARVMDHRL